MRRSPASPFVAALLTACTATQSQSPVDSASAVTELKNTFTEVETRRAKFEKSLPEYQQACDLTAGECRITVGEKRDQFLQNNGRSNCRQPDPELEARCITKEMIGREDLTLATEYYSAQVWCYDRLLECIQTQETQAASNSVVARASTRRKAIEESDVGMTERSRGSVAAEKIKYIRATLPPDAEGECNEVRTKDSCLEAAHGKEAAYLKEFDRSDDSYQRENAVKLLQSLSLAEVSCYKAELDCLLTRLPKYGETADSKPALEKNFAILEQRQKLIIKLGQAFAQPCLDEATETHQPEIIRSYLAYVREPVLFFRRQLHRAFLTMHQTQVDCLKRSP